VHDGLSGLHGRNRTCDLSLRRRTLYPLSYAETFRNYQIGLRSVNEPTNCQSIRRVGLDPGEQEARAVENRPSFSEIEPLLVERRVDKARSTLWCVFECPVTQRRVNASAVIRQGSGLADRLLDSASRSFWYELRHAVARTVCSYLPEGFLREVVRGTAWHMTYSGGQADEIASPTEIREAAVDAFLSVRQEFEREDGQWRSREVVTEFVTDFERQLREAPVSTRYEGEIMARTLNSMAELEGRDEAELAFLHDMAIDPSQMDPPSAVELSELRPEVKPTVYMLAAAVALIDQQRSQQEIVYLGRLQRDMELSSEQASKLRRAAGQFVVEQCLGLNLSPDPEQMRQLAQLADMSVQDVERVLVRRRKRSVQS
jgi:hypothetical protein